MKIWKKVTALVLSLAMTLSASATVLAQAPSIKEGHVTTTASVVEAVHMICFANNEKNCWKMSQTNQMPLRCRMMQQLAPITLNV